MNQIEEARKGNLTEATKAVAEEEGLSPESLMGLVAERKVVILVNPIHSPHAIGIGQGLRTKVNVNIGKSSDFPDVKDELEKVAIKKANTANTVPMIFLFFRFICFPLG